MLYVRTSQCDYIFLLDFLQGLRETFQLLDDPDCDKLGRQSWVLVAIVVTELLICIKFGWSTITKNLPRHIALWWVLGAGLLLIYTVIKFYLLKPDYIPKPEKENIRMGSPVKTVAEHKDLPGETVVADFVDDNTVQAGHKNSLQQSCLHKDNLREDKKYI